MVCAVIIFFGLDILILQCGFYSRYLNPHSSSALVLRCVTLVTLAEKEKPRHFVAVFGDSRLQAGFSAKEFDKLAAEHSLAALKLSVPGSRVREWYYLLRHVDPDCNAFKYIVFVLPSYWDENYPESLSNYLTDIHALLPLLTVSEQIDFVSSFTEFEQRLEAVLCWLVKMYGYRQSLAAFVQNPLTWLADCAYWRANWQRLDYEYEGEASSVEGLRVSDGRLIVPKGLLSDRQEQYLKTDIFRPTVYSDFNSDYMKFWLSRIVNRYSNSATKIVFVCIPKFVLPEQIEQPHIHRTIDYLSHFSNVIAEPENEFEFLRQPKYFSDATHLNRDGNRLFTNLLCRRILELDQASPVINK
jgi:hypothetical protein